jgi:hypothetical protein
MKHPKLILLSLLAFLFTTGMSGYHFFNWYTSDAQLIRRTLGNRVLVRYEQGRAVELIYPGAVEQLNPFEGLVEQYSRTHRSGDPIEANTRRVLWEVKEWYEDTWSGSGRCELHELPPEIGQLSELRHLEVRGCLGLIEPA